MNKDNFKSVRSGVGTLEESAGDAGKDNHTSAHGSHDQVAGNVAVGAASSAPSSGDISDQIAKLTQTVSDLVQTQASAARDQVMSAVGVASDTLAQSAAATQDKLVSMEEDVGARIRKNPWSAVAIAALIGLLIGKI